MTLTSYRQLKQHIKLATGSSEKHNEILSLLKELFRDNINSVRRFEQVNSIGNLLKVLEIRDVLSEDNVTCLKDIARKLPNRDEILKKITDYENSIQQSNSGNHYESIIVSNTMKQKEESSNLLLDSMYNDNKKKQRIFQTVAEEIGSFWRDLGRNLKVRECVIDEIDFQNKNLTEKATKMMETFDEKADRQKWFFVLCTALEKSRRRDLVRSIQEIMTMNI